VQFKVIGDNLAKVTDATTKASLAIDVFGKSGTQLLPLLADGEKGLQALEDRARDLGLTFSQEDADAATKFGDIFRTSGSSSNRSTSSSGKQSPNSFSRMPKPQRAP
jgi:hypothetical protein